MNPIPDPTPDRKSDVFLRAADFDREVTVTRSRVALGLGVMLLIFDLAVILTQVPGIAPFTHWVLRGFWVLAFVIAINLYYRARNNLDPNATEFNRALREQAHAVVWFYEMRSRSVFGSASLLRMHLRDDHMIQTSIHPRDVNEAILALEQLMPAAMSGFSRENAERYHELITGKK